MIGTLIELTSEQRLAVQAFQRVYGSVRVRRGPVNLPDSIVLEGMTRPRVNGRRRVVHAILVTP
jgi:hypothetical protein